VSHDVTTPLSGTVFRPSAGTSYHQPEAEVSMFTHYENMKGDEKYKNWSGRGHTRSSETSPFDKSAYDFLFDFNRNYASILYRFRLIARFL